MAGRRFLFAVSVAAALSLPGFLAPAPLSAQTDVPAEEPAGETPESYYMDQSGGEIRFIQRLSWPAADYVWCYEVIIQQERDGAFSEVLREKTEQPFIELSLPAGQYRYALVAYDLLELPGEQSAWQSFEVLLALQPELRSFFPEGFFLDEDAQWELSLNGRNIDPAAEIYLRHGNRTIVPVEKTVSSSLSGARLVFNERQLVPGLYEIYIKNPGGLETSAGAFSIAFRKPLDIYYGAVYAPLFPLYGELNTLFDHVVFPLGAELRLGLVPIKRTFGYLGVELAAGWHYFSAVKDDYKVSFHALEAKVNLLYQRWFSNRVMALVFRTGGGVTMMTNYHFEYTKGSTTPLNILMPQIEAGAAFLWIIKKPYYVEAGIDYTHWFSKDTTPPGYLRPWIGGGWQR